MKRRKTFSRSGRFSFFQLLQNTPPPRPPKHGVLVSSSCYEYFRYTYVVEETTKPFVYLQDIKKKKDLEVTKTKIRKPDYFESNNDLLILLNRSNRTPYEDYLYALLLINAGTMPFFYALPFPPSRDIKKVVFDDNIIRIYAPEERDIVILGESIESSSFTFAVVR